MSFFDSFNQFFATAGVEIQAALDETGAELTKGWDSFLVEVNAALEEIEAEFAGPPEGTNDERQDAYGQAADWQENIRECWEQPPSSLPIHIDLPRLVTKLKIYEDGKVLWSCDPEGSPARAIFALFRFLKEKLGDSNFPEIPEQAEEKASKGDGSIVNYLESYFQREEADASTTIRLLKGVNQKLLFPAYYRVKHTFRYVQMNDKPNTWMVDVIFGEDSIVVSHNKIQVIPGWALDKSRSGPEEAASFKWALKLSFDPAVTQLKDVNWEIVSGMVDEDLFPDKEMAEFFRSVIPCNFSLQEQQTLT